MNAELEKVKFWLKANKLSLKTSKTKFYLLHSLKKTIEIRENWPLFMINKASKSYKILWRIFGSKHFVETSY